jgi:hypothetical protein
VREALKQGVEWVRGASGHRSQRFCVGAEQIDRGEGRRVSCPAPARHLSWVGLCLTVPEDCR